MLRVAPYNHEWGATIYAKVSATNILGTSPESTAGNGAIMLTTPDPPENLANVPSETTDLSKEVHQLLTTLFHGIELTVHGKSFRKESPRNLS